MTAVILTVIAVGLNSLFLYSKKHHSMHNRVTNQDEDQEVIDTCIKYGSDPEKDHVIDFLFIGDVSGMDKLKDILLSQGYQQDMTQTDKMLVMQKSHKLHIDEIKPETQKMEELAKQYNVEFDGWSTAIVR